MGRRARRIKRFEFVFGATSGLGFLVGEKRQAVGDRNLVVVRMNFRKGQESLPVASVLDESGLQGRFDPGYLGEINISLERSFRGRLKIKFFDFLSVENNDP